LHVGLQSIACCAGERAVLHPVLVDAVLHAVLQNTALQAELLNAALHAVLENAVQQRRTCLLVATAYVPPEVATLTGQH